jgi:hypothetical protein
MVMALERLAVRACRYIPEPTPAIVSELLICLTAYILAGNIPWRPGYFLVEVLKPFTTLVAILENLDYWHCRWL